MLTQGAVEGTETHSLDGTTDQLELLEGEYNCMAVPMTPITTENAADFLPTT